MWDFCLPNIVPVRIAALRTSCLRLWRKRCEVLNVQVARADGAGYREWCDSDFG